MAIATTGNTSMTWTNTSRCPRPAWGVSIVHPRKKATDPGWCPRRMQCGCSAVGSGLDRGDVAGEDGARVLDNLGEASLTEGKEQWRVRTTSCRAVAPPRSTEFTSPSAPPSPAMDFDEYDYLEKTVENPEVPKVKLPAANGVQPEDSDHGKGSRGRPDEGGREGERTSRRDKLADGGTAREHDRHRDASRHRSSPDHRSRDGERREKERHRSGSRREYRERDRDREERGRKDKEREKERDGEKDRERDRERIRERDREADVEREREREKSRHSRSHSEKQHEEPDKYMERSKEVEFREREPKERERDGRCARAIFRRSFWNLCLIQNSDMLVRGVLDLFHRPSSSDAYEEMGVAGQTLFLLLRHKEKKEEGAEPEVDPERDQRTVFAYQISLKADERDVYEFFSRAGKVRDVRLIMDRNSRRSKGVGYIEFYDVMSVPMAIALSGQKLLGQAVMVKPSEAEKNLVQSNTATATGAGGLIGPYSGGARRLYVGISESCSKGMELLTYLICCLVNQGHSNVREDARAAQSLNGQLEIAGRTIKVSAVSDQVGMQDVGSNAGDFDDDEGGGLGLDARSRALLMQKLDRSGVTTSVATSLVTPPLSTPTSVLGAPPGVANPAQPSVPGLLGLPGSSIQVAAAAVPQVDTIGVPSECLLLKNMFDPSLETEPDFDLDIKEDVQDECSKFGTVKHIFVDKNSAGHVFLRFDNVTSAVNAQRALHGRWFAGKMITATFMLPESYDAQFPGNA
ncbi:hypothetical protein Taro_016174 [Colocasia esculenta]|uniref:RRM domain-containing protein n=1 Tax=Colocasia esculenta TaxID=4460 RepID=A0A843UPF2_COLES|nr:hypothetical protein [Colocasia esculenta]